MPRVGDARGRLTVAAEVGVKDNLHLGEVLGEVATGAGPDGKGKVSPEGWVCGVGQREFRMCR